MANHGVDNTEDGYWRNSLTEILYHDLALRLRRRPHIAADAWAGRSDRAHHGDGECRDGAQRLEAPGDGNVSEGERRASD